MNAVITYNEISNFVEKQYKIRPVLNTIDSQTVEVSYKPGAFLPSIGVKLRIDDVVDDIVHLSYDCGAAASLMIAGIVAYLEQKLPNGIEVNTTDKRIVVSPQKFKELEKVLEHVALNTIRFEDDSVNLALMMV